MFPLRLNTLPLPPEAVNNYLEARTSGVEAANERFWGPRDSENFVALRLFLCRVLYSTLATDESDGRFARVNGDALRSLCELTLALRQPIPRPIPRHTKHYHFPGGMLAQTEFIKQLHIMRRGGETPIYSMRRPKA